MGNYVSFKPKPSRPPKTKGLKSFLKEIIILAILIAMTAGVFFFVTNRNKDQQAQKQAGTSQNASATPKETPKEEPEASLELQPVVDDWVANHDGDYSVTIMTPKGKTIASYDEDKAYFTASIYKLFVAYEGYQKIAKGEDSMGDAYLSGYNRGECLDAMIRDSYSPCGEKMWAELGKQSLTDKLKTYGLTGTNMTGLQTTSHDAAIILQRLYARKELTEEHTKLFLDSMKTQEAKFRRGLPSGVTKGTTYDKVGWNEALEWHDTAIVEFENGKTLIITVLTRSAGMNNVKGLAAAIQKVVNP